MSVGQHERTGERNRYSYRHRTVLSENVQGRQRSYYDKVNLEKDFSLYNTPVLDFIQVTQKKKDASIIALICGNERYAKGLNEVIAVYFRADHAILHTGKH